MGIMTKTCPDTRTAYRDARPSRPARRASTTGGRGGAVELALFRRLVRDLILAPHGGREAARAKVVGYLTAARDPDPAFGELLFECADRGRPDGLDLATDVVARVGPAAARYARRLLTTDGPKWKPADRRRRVTDNVWYALLRGMGQSAAEPVDQLVPLLSAAFGGTVGIREAAAHALGDFADRGRTDFRLAARSVLEQMAKTDAAATVRESAAEVLHGLEG